MICIRADNIDEIFQALVANGLKTTESQTLPGLTMGLVNQTWAMREFPVRDPDGSRLTFGQCLMD
ncbi:hypothetical protein AB833_14770 [Chromatiales bacterium (ex Bugula neritina AB1)]|nr:hypothetical protein AB833_14770 [Chromatiales bacterium (ex Bugula neritina AB1)]